jgi:fluoride ion exporter CrcB/FEX
MNIKRDIIESTWYRLIVAPILVTFLTALITWHFVKPQDIWLALAAGIGGGLGTHSYFQVLLRKREP